MSCSAFILLFWVQLAVNLHDFEDAEPDSLVHSVPAILDWFMQQGVRCKYALKALCRKKGLHVEVHWRVNTSLDNQTYSYSQNRCGVKYVYPIENLKSCISAVNVWQLSPCPLFPLFNFFHFNKCFIDTCHYI